MRRWLAERRWYNGRRVPRWAMILRVFAFVAVGVLGLLGGSVLEAIERAWGWRRRRR